MNIIGTGLSGLVGSRVVELLSPRHTFTNLSLETNIDITDKVAVRRVFHVSDAQWVFHFAAKTDVDGCEKDKPHGKNGAAWKINVESTENIVRLCKKYGKKLLYLATDYDFSGTKNEYKDNDEPDPLSWYGITKAEGEKRVMSMGERGLVLRIANPYRSSTGTGKKDFVHKMKERMESGLPVRAATDSIFTPTFIDDIATAIEACISRSAYGRMNCVGSDSLSPYEAARVIARTWLVDEQSIESADFSAVIGTRAPRPLRAALKNAKIFHYGVSMKTFAEGIEELKRQEDAL